MALPVQMNVEGTGKVQARLRAVSLKGAVRGAVGVSYSAPYATFVHEDLEAYHPVGQAKFLEEPFRRLLPQLRKTIQSYLKNRRSLEEGLLAAGRMLLEASLPLGPVDTGLLKSTGAVGTQAGPVNVKVEG